ncbi:MAG: hypothetical protein IJU18_05760 [Oscillospiraceae bacterium]|nr:hypothetical protein [Oscillospiraceae bacterium]
MSRPAVPWDEVRRRYQQGEEPASLAQRYGVSVDTVRRHARQERWNGAGRPDVRPRLAQACRQLQCAAAAMMSRAETDGEVSVKDVKELAALLRELAALEKSLVQEAPPAVRVVLAPETEAWSV